MYSLEELDRMFSGGSAGVVTPAQPTAPQPQANIQTPEAPEKKDVGFLGTVADVGKGVVGGVLDAVDETLKMGYDVANFFDDNVFHTDYLDGEYDDLIPDVDTQTTAGNVARGIAKFMAGFVGAGKILKGAKLLQGAGKGVAIARGALQGAMADFTVFDPHEERFSNLLAEFPVLQNPVTEYLSADEDDSELEGRLKNVLEGLALGAITEPFAMWLGGLRKARKMAEAGQQTAAKEAVEQASKQVGEVIEQARHSGVRGIDTATGRIGSVVDEGEDSVLMSFRDKQGNEVVERIAKENVNIPKGGKYKTDEELLEGLGVDMGRHEEHATARVQGLDRVSQDVREVTKKYVLETGELPKAKIFKDIINLDYIDTTEDAKRVIQGISDGLLEGFQKKGIKGPDAGFIAKTLETEHHDDLIAQALSDVADYLGEDPQAWMEHLAKQARASDDNTRFLLSAKMFIDSLGEDIASTSLRLEVDHTLADEARLIQRVETLAEVMHYVKHLTASSGRVLRASRIITSDILNGKELDAIQNALARVGGSEKVMKFAKRLRAAGTDPKKIIDLAQMSKAEKFWGLNNEYWINAILSGPKTHIINVISNAVMTAVSPAEMMLGGALKGNWGLMREGGRIYVGLFKYWTDALSMASHAFKVNENVIDPGHMVFDAGGNKLTRMWDSRTFGMNETTGLAKGVDFLGAAINMPGRFLMASDEFFKQINYRASLYSHLYGKAVDLGIKDPKAISEFIEENFSKAFKITTDGKGNEVLGQGLAKQFMRYAQETTFTQELEKGLGKTLQQLAATHPPLRMILPFVRTPTNIVRAVWDRTPLLNRTFFKHKQMIEAGGREAAVAAGRTAMGAMFWGTAAMMAMNGRITGGGPKDPNQRAMLYNKGWQPYSLVTTDESGNKKYISLNRLDPFGMFFGLAADLVAVGGHLGDAELSDIASAMTIALANNLTSKTYLKGLADALQAFNQPDRYMDSWLKRFASTYVPNFVNDAPGFGRKQKDPLMREVRGVLDHIMNKIPGLSDQLPAKINWVTGKPITYPGAFGPDSLSPFATDFEDRNDVVAQEMARLGHGFSPPSKTIGNVELTPQQYSRLCELHGTVKVQGKTLQQFLKDTMQRPEYDINRERIPDAPDEYTSHRITMLKGVIGGFRQKALLQLMDEDGDLKRKVYQDRMNKANVKGGKLDDLVELGK